MGGARRRALAVGCAAVVLLGGCGSGASSYRPTGIDELTIPTPSPRSADFVAHVDNVWLPLRPGRTWTYDVTRPGHPTGTSTVTVLRTAVVVDGISTTAVRTVIDRGGDSPVTQTDYYAQDRAGGVWWFGRAGLWRAGAEGARAGLVLTATPRLGDGYRAGYEKGRVEDVVTVTRAAPAVALEWTSALSPGAPVWETLKRGVGLVERVDDGTGERWRLRSWAM